jgi:hypothetical protein
MHQHNASGFEIRFDEHQVLTTVFCYVQPCGDIAGVDRDFIGVPQFESTIGDACQGRQILDDL